MSFFLSIIKRKSKYMNVATETQIKEKEDPKTFSLTLTGDQRKYLTYTGIALAGYFLARHLVKSAVKSLKDNDDL